jgi:hypothetical protein
MAGGTAYIGHKPALLSVDLLSGETGEAAWVAKGPDGTPIPWSSAPVLHLPGDVVVTATLSAEGAVADARATWLITAPDVATVKAAIGSQAGEARVKVGGRTMFRGNARVDQWP